MMVKQKISYSSLLQNLYYYDVLILSIFLFLLAGCSAVTSVQEKDIALMKSQDDQFLLWMLSDIQPRSKEERIHFETAIKDVKDNIDKVDVAVMAGDLLKSRSKNEAFDWFIKTRKAAPVLQWYEIAGNHDVRSGQVFQKYFPRPSHYGVSVGNILILLLSDQSVASRTDISDEAYEWWAKMVRENQDKIIITVTHAQLRHSGLLGSILGSRRIAGSERFESVLREQRVAVWASGHSHLPHSLTATVTSKKKFRNTCFVNVSSIGESVFQDNQSRFFVFTPGSATLWLRSRNHTKQRFDEEPMYSISLEKPFVWDGQPAKLLLP